jgi:argininosuccinate synthase
VWCAERVGADALAHGCTGKGNDQVRFELTFLALAPHLTVIAPWREWDIVSREDALDYAARHGVGRVDLVESRLVGMKSRGVYETPAGTVLHEALEDLCRLTLPHDLFRTRSELGPRMADLIYSGQWFTPLRRALQAFADAALEVASGEVSVELFHGRAQAVARTSPQSLYRGELASFNMTGYDSRHAEGFIRLFGLPVATVARRDAANAGNRANGSNGTGAHPAPVRTATARAAVALTASARKPREKATVSAAGTSGKQRVR